MHTSKNLYDEERVKKFGIWKGREQSLSWEGMIDRPDDVAGTFAARVIMHESHDSMHSDAMLARKVWWCVYGVPGRLQRGEREATHAKQAVQIQYRQPSLCTY
jgi:hypothetical protein